jgi:hypothetical protein
VQHLVLLQSRPNHSHKTLLQQRQQFLLTALAAAHKELSSGCQALSMLLNSSIEFGNPHVLMGLGSQDRSFPPLIAGMHMDQHAELAQHAIRPITISLIDNKEISNLHDTGFHRLDHIATFWN